MEVVAADLVAHAFVSPDVSTDTEPEEVGTVPRPSLGLHYLPEALLRPQIVCLKALSVNYKGLS